MTSLPSMPRSSASPADDGHPRLGGGPGVDRVLGRAVLDGIPTTPVVTETDEPGQVDVTFLAEEPDDRVEVMVHVNGITDAHREDVTPAILQPIAGTTLRHLTYRLPRTMVASYRLVRGAPLPRDAGSTREGWLAVHQGGRPDPHNPSGMHRPLGAPSSVMELPGARLHPAWSPTRPAAPAGSVTRSTLPEGFLSRGRTVWTYQPAGGPAERLLVLLDGDTWHALDVYGALDQLGDRAPAAVLVSSVDPDVRSAQLPYPGLVASLLEQHVLPLAHEVLGRHPGPDQTILSGQSYGGLAAAGVAVTRPDLATSAVVQSGSFHFREGQPAQRPGQVPGTLVHRLAAGGGRSSHADLAHTRLVVQAGSEEGTMSALAQVFCSVARSRGAAVHFTERTGGHDYAWWRHGLLDGLDRLAEPWHVEG